jgi:hypothetical protein
VVPSWRLLAELHHSRAARIRVAGAEPEATPQTHRLRPWGFPTVSPSHPSVFPHHGIQRITVEFSEKSQQFSINPIETTTPVPEVEEDDIGEDVGVQQRFIHQGTAAMAALP